jgi:hypothetical protein
MATLERIAQEHGTEGGPTRTGPRGQPVEFRPSKIDPHKLQSFREAYFTNRGNAYRAAIAIGIEPKLAKAHSWELARAVNVQLGEALAVMGVDAMSQAKQLIRLLRSKNERIRLDAIKEINRIFDAYPAPKPNVEPITFELVIDMKV